MIAAACTGPEKVMRAGRKADGLDRAAMGSEQLRAMEEER
jgi:hypothetical protein